jgi:cyclopropane-fatty-acyl-phospholipid synthase
VQFFGIMSRESGCDMLLHRFNSVMRATETDMLPDVAVRFGIRKLLKQQLNDISGGHPEARNERFGQFLTDCRSSPVAVVPELANEQHYEVPAEFFRTVLGSRLNYGCCHLPMRPRHGMKPKSRP